MYVDDTDPDICPLIHCILVDWLGPDVTTKGVKFGALKFFTPFTSPPETVNVT
jgi:hypothetical protein